nr:helix-turn-helix transcriptional regulator [Eubacterium sp.]
MDTTALNTILGTRIRHLRNHKKMTREQLAEKIDVSSRFLADLESGKTGVSLSTLIKICHVLDSSADYLLGISDCSEEEQLLTELSLKLKRIDSPYLPYLNEIIDSFIQAINEHKK